MLDAIRDELQEIVQTINAVIGIDITIMDKSLQRIAGTGKFKKTIGSCTPKNSVFEKCLTTGKQYFLDNPVNCIDCTECEAKEFCEEKAEACFPLVIDGNVEGVIGMTIFDETQKEILIRKQDSYKNFGKRISELISSRIKENTLNKWLQYKSIELITVIDSVAEGIIILDYNNNILCLNRYIKHKLNLDNSIINKSILEILPKNMINKFNKTQSKIEFEPISIGNSTDYFIISIEPIKFENKISGSVITFKNFNKMEKSVFKIRENSSAFSFDNIISNNKAFVQIKEQCKQIATQHIPVLLLGESGTGKELFARAIHSSSKVQNEIFMPINCGAIPENLVESELFGYEKGAFTGANTRGKLGMFEIAKDGTIFLDEIGDLPLHIQVKLLRVLEEKTIIRVGGVTPIKVNPRIIAATNKNLYDMVNKNEFREDLFYRLNVIPINIPPLRERQDDILTLSQYFLKKYNSIYNKNIMDFTEECKSALMKYNFPGNIRELRNLIEYAINFEQSKFITLDVIRKKIFNHDCNFDCNIGLKAMVEKYENEIINKYINYYGSDLEAKKKIAKLLKISTATLYRKLD